MSAPPARRGALIGLTLAASFTAPLAVAGCASTIEPPAEVWDFSACAAPGTLQILGVSGAGRGSSEVIDAKRMGAWNVQSSDAGPGESVAVRWRFPGDGGSFTERSVVFRDGTAPLRPGRFTVDGGVGLEVRGGTQSCQATVGAFEIRALDRDGGALEQVAATFNSRCANGSVVSGCVNAVAGLAPPAAATDAGPDIQGGLLGDDRSCSASQESALFLNGDPGDAVHPGPERFTGAIGELSWIGTDPPGAALGMSAPGAEAYVIGAETGTLEVGRIYHGTGALVPYGSICAWGSCCPEGADGRTGSGSDLWFQVRYYQPAPILARVLVTFYQRCAGAAGGLRGCFRY